MKKERISAIMIFVAVMVCAASFFGVGAHLKYDFGEDDVTVTCKDYQVTIEYKNVSSLELIEVQDYGAPADGGSDRSYRWGGWENLSWGSYVQCTTKNTDQCILLVAKDGAKYLLNYEGERSTVELYELFCGLMESKGYLIK